MIKQYLTSSYISKPNLTDTQYLPMSNRYIPTLKYLTNIKLILTNAYIIIPYLIDRLLALNWY